MSSSQNYKHILPDSQGPMWDGCEVLSLGVQDIAPGEAYPPADIPEKYSFAPDQGRILEEYQLIYICRGGGKFTSASLDYVADLAAGSMIILFPGEKHSYMPDQKTGWKEFWIGFRSTRMDDLIANGFISKRNPVLYVGQQDQMIRLYNYAIQVAEDGKQGTQALLAGIVSHLTSLAYVLSNTAINNSEVEKKINRAKMLIEEYLPTITPEELAKELYMSYSSFRKIFKEVTGVAPANYIADVKFNHVKDALANSGRPIKEIAAMVGFNNYYYFLTAFKNHEGVTPNDYRNGVRNK